MKENLALSPKSTTNTTGAGEQVYEVVKNPDGKAEDVEENYAIL